MSTPTRASEVPPAEAEGAPEFVYFIRAGDRVKIGRSRSPENRLRQLQTASGERLRLLGSFVGSARIEAQLHRTWSHLRIVGAGREWFTAAPDLLRYISAVCNPKPPSPEQLAAAAAVGRVVKALAPADLGIVTRPR
jgi:hypothetical protein